MKPSIEFKHVLSELSVNRTDPCEVIRELISNSYDAGAKNIFYSPISDSDSFIFFDDGCGLDTEKEINGITPWESFFSIGSSTKQKGSGIGYKCQGSKLCFASSRVLVATRKSEKWLTKIIENPRNNLDIDYDISPSVNINIHELLRDFFTSSSQKTEQSINMFISFIEKIPSKTGTLIVINGLDVENFNKNFCVGDNIEKSYIYNYIKFNTRHGHVCFLTSEQGFIDKHIQQVSDNIYKAKFIISYASFEKEIDFGYPYLSIIKADPQPKSPLEISRLNDGRFFDRYARSFSIAALKYNIIIAIDGNRRTHEDYKNLDRRGSAQSGVKLADQRGFFISVKGIKICKYLSIIESIPEYKILSEGNAQSHYTIILDGDFDLVTNRNSLSTKSSDALTNKDLINEIKKSLDFFKNSSKNFLELISRLKKESSEALLNEQINKHETLISETKSRIKFRISDKNNKKHLFLSPNPGEEYLVGILYATLRNFVDEKSEYIDYWKKVITFSTQGIDSLALNDENSNSPLNKNNIKSVEYKYEFNNLVSFNHPLPLVDYIVAWKIDIDAEKGINDTYTCSGKLVKSDHPFKWMIKDIENEDGCEYRNHIFILDLKELIRATFKNNVDFSS